MRRRGWLWIAVVGSACVLYPWLVHALILEADSAPTRTVLAILNGVPHAAINLFLIWVFGSTLRRGREPLITGFARRVHGILPPEIESYTRSVTLAWCLFFAAQVATSALLLLFAPLDAWSFFVNALGFPLIAAMFIGEYAVRLLRFPNFSHASIWKGVQLFTSSGRRSATPADPRRN